MRDIRKGELGYIPYPGYSCAIFTEEEIIVFQQIAELHGVTVEVLNLAGDEYTHKSRQGEFTGIVPEGQAYVRLTQHVQSKLTEFNEHAYEIIASQQIEE